MSLNPDNNSAAARKIANQVYSIGQWKGGHCHAFLVDSDDGLILIDTLFDSDGGPVLKALESIGRTPNDLKHIILTHAHRSHLGGVAALKKLCGAKVWCHQWEADVIAGERKAQPCSIIPRRPLAAYPLQFGLALGLMPHVPCDVDRFLRTGDKIGPLEVMHAPGHSPGHLAFYWKERSVLFAGDALATWPYFSLGWPGLNLNAPQCRRTLRALEDIDAAIIAVGHGDPAIGEDAEKLRRLIRER